MSAVAAVHPRTTFDLPDELAAIAPPESRGLARDLVRLLVASPLGVTHSRFRDLPRFLRAGDLVVINTSGTLPAAVDATRTDGRQAVVHVSTTHGDDATGAPVVELRQGQGKNGPVLDAEPGERVRLVGGAMLTLLEPVAADGKTPRRLWRAHVDVEAPLDRYLAKHGRPIRYSYVPRAWPLRDYQTVYARQPGSAEMPSAGRPFTPELVTRLVSGGVAVAPLVLHTGVSSLESYEPPYPEWYEVPPATARLVRGARESGHRVVAVGTTVVRALESVAATDGHVSAGRGWTDLVLGAERPARVVDGLVTGLHAPGASHLALLEAVAGTETVQRAYEAALTERYHWHEFGDSCLLLP